MIDTVEYVIWLYGSEARGDKDDLSDIDVFLASDTPDPFEHPSIPVDPRTSVSRYTWSEVRAMAAYGSLFLHHLQCEGRPLAETLGGGSHFRKLLESLPRYQLYRRDLRAFRSLLVDVRAGQAVGSTPTFEMAVLGTLVRHSSVLACYLLGTPCFGRDSGVRIACAGLALGELTTELQALYGFRLHADGRCAQPYSPTWLAVERAAGLIELYLSKLDEAADAYQATLPQADRSDC